MERLCVDLFSGAGGATLGLTHAGFTVVAAVENDSNAADTYAENHSGIILFSDDIRMLDAWSLRRYAGLERGELALLKACPPCQGFSKLAKGEIDERRNDLVLDVFRFVAEFMPQVLLLENVPGLQHDWRLAELRICLSRLGYSSRVHVVDATEFGVPQRRARLILLAVRSDGPDIPKEHLLSLLPADFDSSPRNAGEALRELSEKQAATDPLDLWRKSSSSVAERIAAVPRGGTRFDLPERLQLDCHRRLDQKGKRVATASYGRVLEDHPAPTMTTRCTTPSCGAFIHPTLDRGLSLREAATLQTFPPSYHFVGGYDSIERQIGNAVPVRMAHALGLAAASIIDRW